MKKEFTYLLIFILAIAFWRCNEEDSIPEVNSSPAIGLENSVIHTSQGREFVMEAHITDDAPIESVNLKNTDWFLNKTIKVSKDSSVNTYDLYYVFTVPDDAPNKEHTITITATNIGQKSSSVEMKVLMDGDFVNPSMTLNSPVDGLTLAPKADLSVEFDIDISDDRKLGYFVIKEEKLNFYDSIYSFGGKEYSYVKSVSIPNDQDNYQFFYVLSDSAGNTVESSSEVKVSLDFDKMYLADVATEEELTSDLFGVPMLIDKTAPFTFEAKYYSSAANTEIKFIPQKTSFTPHCYGVDPANSGKLINDPANALPIVLPEVGYYKINFSLKNGEFTLEKYEPTDKPYSEYMNMTDDPNNHVGPLSMPGVGWPDFQNSTGWGWDGPDAAPLMTEDPNNQYIWTREIELEGNVQFIFAPEHPDGWWLEPYWRFDVAVDPEETVLLGGTNVDINVPVKTTYIITFDTHLNRAKAIKK